MPVKKTENKTANKPQQKKEACKVNGLPATEAVSKEFDRAIAEFKRQAKRQAFVGNALMFSPFIACALFIFITINGWVLGILTTALVLFFGWLIGRFIHWATKIAVKGEMKLAEINRFQNNKNDIVNMLAKDLGKDFAKFNKLHQK